MDATADFARRRGERACTRRIEICRSCEDLPLDVFILIALRARTRCERERKRERASGFEKKVKTSAERSNARPQFAREVGKRRKVSLQSVLCELARANRCVSPASFITDLQL